MKRLAIAAFAAALLAGTASAQVPKEQLLSPPEGAQKLLIVSAAGRHGTAAIWRLPDGSIATRDSLLLRGMVWEQDEVIRLNANGIPDRIVVRGVTPSGDSAETFEVQGGTARWKSQIDEGSAPFDGKVYSTANGTWASTAAFAELLYESEGRRLKLLPGGEARLTRLTDIAIGKGASAKTVTAWAIEGVGLEPYPVLLDSDGKFFGQVGVMAILPEAYEGDFLKIQAAQIEALAARSPAIAARFGGVAATPVAFTHVKLFDSEKGQFLADRTVIANAGRIVSVGPSASTAIPAGARVIDGTGKTLTPGLWDAHMHVGSDLQGVMLLSMGETSARNPGAEVEPTVVRNARIAKGELVFPTVFSSVLIDGKGPLQAQGGVTVSSAEEAVAGVRMAKERGFSGVKFYTSMKPEWLRAGIAEAKRLGMHVHGHVPATMRPLDAIAAGYDEVTHINMLMLQAMPDSVVNVSNGIARFLGPGRYAKDVDVDAEPLKTLVATMAERKIVADLTLGAFESVYVPENGDLSPSYAPFVGTMPPATERSFRLGGFQPPEGVTRADFRASWAKMMQLARRLHAAGVPVVAGTDGGGLELVRELELYVDAGFTPAEALQTATIAPARLVGVGDKTGSISVGKEADLVLVDGDPEKRIGDMRRTLWVMSDGALMNADELREVAGFTGRPK